MSGIIIAKFVQENGAGKLEWTLVEIKINPTTVSSHISTREEC